MDFITIAMVALMGITSLTRGMQLNLPGSNVENKDSGSSDPLGGLGGIIGMIIPLLLITQLGGGLGGLFGGNKTSGAPSVVYNVMPPQSAPSYYPMSGYGAYGG